jgi:D-sedoheptulose 7-phosphate isomerase
MDPTALDYVRTHLEESASLVARMAADDGFARSIDTAAQIIATSLRAGGKVLLAGNGGSAGDAQHIAGEFLSRLEFDRAPLAAIALTVDTSVLTAVANDYGYDEVFTRQVRGLGRPGDVFIGISTSGRSPNIIAALAAARAAGLHTIGLTGEDPRDMGPLCDLIVAAGSSKTPLIQQVHIVAAHVICALVERAIFPAVATATR